MIVFRTTKDKRNFMLSIRMVINFTLLKSSRKYEMRDITEQEGSVADGRRLFKVERYSKRRQSGGSRLPNYDVRPELVV